MTLGIMDTEAGTATADGMVTARTTADGMEDGTHTGDTITITTTTTLPHRYTARIDGTETADTPVQNAYSQAGFQPEADHQAPAE